MDLGIHLKTYYNNRANPNCFVTFNNKELANISNITDNDLVLEFKDLEVEEINVLLITHYGKKSNATEIINGNIVSDVGIEVKDIKVDGIKISDNYLWSQLFFPNWSYDPFPQFPFKHNRYLGFNGTWQLILPKDYKNFIVSYYSADRFGL